MVGAGLPDLHLLGAQTGAQAFDQLQRAVALLALLHQQAGSGGGRIGELFGLQRLQSQGMNRRRQTLLAQLLGDQARHMAQVLRGLGRAHHQLAGGRHIAALVQLPDQLEGAQTALAAQQPGLQVQQQAFDTGHQRRRMNHQRVELQLFVERFGQHQPIVAVWRVAAGAVQRSQQRRAKTPGHAVTRQAQQVVPIAATDPLQHAQMCSSRAERVHG